MLHFIHTFGYFAIKDKYTGKPCVWRQCYHCYKSQWWAPISGVWSLLDKHDFTRLE